MLDKHQCISRLGCRAVHVSVELCRWWPPFQETVWCLPQADRDWLEMSLPKPGAAYPLGIPTEIEWEGRGADIIQLPARWPVRLVRLAPLLVPAHSSERGLLALLWRYLLPNLSDRWLAINMNKSCDLSATSNNSSAISPICHVLGSPFVY